MVTVKEIIEEICDELAYAEYESSGADDYGQVRYYTGKQSALRELLRFIQDREEVTNAES